MTSTSNTKSIVHRTPFFYGWVVLALGILGLVSTYPGQSFSVGLFFDHFIEEFDLSRTTVSSLYAIGTMTASILLTFVGRMIDRYGNRRVGGGVSLLFTIALIGFFFISGPISLMVGFLFIRFLGQGSMSLNSTTAITQWFERRRGFVMGLAVFIFALGQSTYVIGVKRLIDTIGWQMTWLVLAAGIGLVSLPLIALFMRDKPEDFGLYTDGDSEADYTTNSLKLNKEQNYTLREAMRTHVFWSLMFASVMTGAWVTALIIHQTSIFAIMGYSAEVAVNTYALISTVNGIMTVLTGLIINRIRAGWLAAIQLVFLGGGLVLSVTMTSQWMTMLYAICIGIAIGIGSVFSGVIWPNLFGRQHQGTIRGVVTMAGVAGTSVGPILFSLSFDSTGNYNLAVIITVVLVGIVVLANLIAPVGPPGLKSEEVIG